MVSKEVERLTYIMGENETENNLVLVNKNIRSYLKEVKAMLWKFREKERDI